MLDGAQQVQPSFAGNQRFIPKDSRVLGSGTNPKQNAQKPKAPDPKGFPSVFQFHLSHALGPGGSLLPKALQAFLSPSPTAENLIGEILREPVPRCDCCGTVLNGETVLIEFVEFDFDSG
jgi:hypothetical protein